MRIGTLPDLQERAVSRDVRNAVLVNIQQTVQSMMFCWKVAQAVSQTRFWSSMSFRFLSLNFNSTA